MAERTNAEPGLIDGITAGLGGPRTSALLNRLDAAAPWVKLAKPIAALPAYRVKPAGADTGGRPAGCRRGRRRIEAAPRLSPGRTPVECIDRLRRRNLLRPRCSGGSPTCHVETSAS